MGRFACEYCGREMMVEWSGEKVAPKATMETVQLLRTGAERTAAELALVRLQRELTDLEDGLSGLRAKSARVAAPPLLPEEPQGWPWMSGTILMVAAAAAFFPSVAYFGVANTLLGILGVGFLAAALEATGKRGQRKRREGAAEWTRSKRALDTDIEAVKREIAVREREIAYQREIVSIPQLTV